MRERLSRYARHERACIRTGICTIKCGINTHEQKDRGGNLRGRGGGYGREQDGDRQRASLGDAEGSHGGREKGGDYERAGRSS